MSNTQSDTNAARRPKRFLVGAVVLAGCVVCALLLYAIRRDASQPRHQRAAAALLELRHGWETNNHRFPSPWPPKIKALGMNSLGANNNSVSAHRIFPIESKIRWSHGYELAGLATNGGPWTLYEENNIYLPRIRRLYWRRMVMTITNYVTAAPLEPASSPARH